MLGSGLLVVFGVTGLLIETGYLNGFHLLHWYIRWWPELLLGVGLMALSEWWLDRNHYCSHGPRLALIICCLTLLLSDHGSFGIYVHGHLVHGEDLLKILAGE